MGIEIYYKGSINKTEFIEQISNDLVDISKKMGWKYQLFDEDLNKERTAYSNYNRNKNIVEIN